MTPLQILRQTLKDRGATVTMFWMDGYHIAVDDVNEGGKPVRWVIEDVRLDQAIQQLLRGIDLVPKRKRG
jgi:hypothetical protein